MKICKINGCNGKVEAEDLCSKHYTKFLKYGIRGLRSDEEKHTCMVEGCGNIHYGLGYCALHYRRFKRYGDPLRTKNKNKCLVEMCYSKATKGGYCAPHYDKYVLGIDRDTSIFKGEE